MLDKAKDGHETALVRRLADWVNAFAAAPVPAATLERARAILLDSLACALYGFCFLQGFMAEGSRWAEAAWRQLRPRCCRSRALR